MRNVLRIAYRVTGDSICVGVAVVLLAGCAMLDPPPPPAPEHKPPTDTAILAAPPEEKPPVVEKPAPLPPFAVPPPPKPQGLQAALVVPPQPAPTVPPPEPPAPLPAPRPETLVGLDPAQTESLLGPPAAVREQSPATIWSYTTTNCRLDLFFYMNMASKRLSALSYDLKNQDGQPNEVLASECLRQLTETGRNAGR